MFPTTNKRHTMNRADLFSVPPPPLQPQAQKRFPRLRNPNLTKSASHRPNLVVQQVLDAINPNSNPQTVENDLTHVVASVHDTKMDTKTPNEKSLELRAREKKIKQEPEKLSSPGHRNIESPVRSFIDNDDMPEGLRRPNLGDDYSFDDLLKKHELMRQEKYANQSVAHGFVYAWTTVIAEQEEEGDECTFLHVGEVIPPKKPEVCKFFKSNSCGKGVLCPFEHNLKLEPCMFYHMRGYCNAADACPYSHESITEEQYTKLTAQYTPQPKPLHTDEKSYGGTSVVMEDDVQNTLLNL
ncbi:hypothetical protein BC938DRAFT_478955 [Jimgerdemannia flammicorona]|uniref:C3H1-type domain-containing protein n=1 Tax=Jimgerdemannia flammicorona TaxID=994334 RepID=A0A433QLZ4_9FUNG|nr:hypothetical protein BC938DRAFT_478955 [Jimgerdemannia flammicorona]